MEKPIKIRLHVLSPIHIGCDDVYEPTSFVIDEHKKKLIKFDPLDFVKSLKPQELAEFSNTASGDNILAIFKTIKRLYNPTIRGKEVEITDYLIEHYEKILRMGTFDKNAVINQFSMNKTAFNPQDNTPYIPGTSLKGALRTAYLSALAAVQKITNAQNAKRFETDLLGGSFDSDPFRMVKVSDLLPVDNVRTKIFYAVNKKKKLSDKTSRAESGPPQIFEAVRPETIFEGSISIQMPERGADIKDPIKKEYLLKAAQIFFAKVLADDEKSFQVIGIKNISDQPHYKHFIELFNKTAFLIRLGRHSGAEAVTIEGNRQIKIIKRPEPLDQATTIWLASDSPRPRNNNDLQPFGWAVLEVLPFDVKEGIYSGRKRIAISDAMQNNIAKPDSGTSQPIQPPKAKPEEDNSITARVKLIKNPQTFSDFIKGIKDNEFEALKVFSFKGMESVINIGLVEALEAAEVSAEIKRTIAQKMLEICKEPDKKYPDKLQKYNKLIELTTG